VPVLTEGGQAGGHGRRVLYIITGLHTGGAEAMLTRVAAGLKERGFDQHVVTLTGRGPHADHLERAGIPVTSVDLRRLLRWLPDILRILCLVRRVRPDVIQGWMYHGDLVAALVHRLVPGRAKRRLFWGVRASNMDDARYARLIRWCARLSRWPDAVIANSAAGLDFHTARGYRPRRSELISNGIDTERFRPDPVARAQMRREWGMSEDRCVAIHVARVDAMKDHETALKAAGRVPDVTIVMVGEGTNTLKSLDNILPLGMRRDVDRLYPAADVVLSTSAFGEGFSNALAEGMSSGLVPIATDVGDARMIVGNAGVVVPPRDPAGLAAALRAEAASPAAERRERGLRARQRIVDNFTLARAVDSFARLYLETERQ
jgi:glycosyltransferase involved in cell wall biosynthesis